MSMAVIGGVATVAGAGASIYGASQAGKGGGKAPDPVDIFRIGAKGYGAGTSLTDRQALGLLDYYRTYVPGFIELQNQLGPEVMNQTFRQSGSFLDKQSALERRAGFQAAKNIADLRKSELKTMRGQTPLVRGLMDKLSPEQARAIDLQQRAMERAQGLESEFQKTSAPISGMFGTMAEEAFARRGVLSPEEQRATEQRAREAATAAGRVGGSAAIAAEIQNREAAQAARRQEASGAAGLASTNLFQTEAQRAALRGEAQATGQNLFSMANQFYTAPGLNLLSNIPNAYKVGTVGAASAISGGPAASGNFDFNMPLNFANQMAGAQNQSNQANYQTNLANQQAKAQMWSSIGSSMMGAGMDMGGGSYGSMLGGGLSSIGGQTGNTGLYNYGANLYNQNIGYGTPQKAYIV
jgi:hypothetical protein